MVRHRWLRAAVATIATVAAVPLAAGLAGAPAYGDDPDLRGPGTRATTAPLVRAAAPRRTARRAADKATPLAVTIETLTPSAIPAKGKIRVAGTVTNTDSVPWLAVNTYSFISQEPMTTRAELAAAVQVDESTTVGERITTFGDYYSIDSIEPGESKQFTFTVDVDLLKADAPGVYWFGVHALGQRSGEGRDELAVADGRARTFLARVPEGREGREALSVVVPLRGTLEYADDGSLANLERWTTTLGPGGRLRSLVELAATAGDRTVSWVVDPALVDAVRQLAAGNPARSLAANLEEGQPDGDGETTDAPTEGTAPSNDASGTGVGGTPTGPPTESPTDGSSTSPTDDPVTAELPSDLDPATTAAAQAAREWLGRLRAAMDDSDEVLALPYGDLDVSAATRHDARVYPRARNRAQGPLPGLGVATSPVVAAPSGYLSPEAVESLDESSMTLVSDKMVHGKPSVATVDGHRLVVTSSGAAQGGPGPGDALGMIALRQRVLAEAAVRFLRPARSPLVVLLPPDWVPPASSNFFSGLDVDWLDLTSVASATGNVTAEPVSPDELRYPSRQAAYELDAANFEAAEALRKAGASLQDLLTLNDLVGGTVSDQSLASTSYASRARPDSTRVATDRSRAWIQDRTAQVGVTAPQAVTLSSINGSFPTSISNGLDEPVTVSLRARSDNRLEIVAPTEVDIPAKSSQTVLLDASTDKPGIHEVTLLVTDTSGNALGGSDQLSIRSARVSNVIWLFLITGIGLLFGTIAFRLVRRVRAARR